MTKRELSRLDLRRLLLKQLSYHADLAFFAKCSVAPWNVRYQAVVMAEQAQENIDELRRRIASMERPS